MQGKKVSKITAVSSLEIGVSAVNFVHSLLHTIALQLQTLQHKTLQSRDQKQTETYTAQDGLPNKAYPLNNLMFIDETTPDLIDRNIMYAKILLKPTRSVEFFAIDFVITNTGASFDD